MSVAGRSRGERGNAALEFALVAPLLAVLVLGGIDWGFYLVAQQVVTNAAREGARAGSIFGGTDADALAEAARRARECIGQLRNRDRATVDASLGTGGGSVIVSVACPAGSVTGFANVLVPAAARATAEMRRWKP